MHVGTHLISRITGASIALIAAFSLCGSAFAASSPHGSMTQPGVPGRGCLTHAVFGATTCEDVPNGVVSGVAVSADGKSVYTVDATTGGGLDQFARDTSTGALTLVGCDRVLADAECSTTVPGIGRASGVAVSPDGKSVYVVGAATGAVLQFMRDASTSTVARGACYGGTTCIRTDGVVGATAVAVSPDGKFVFVVGASDPPAGGTLAVFARNTRTGALTSQGCFGDQSEHCAPAVALDGPSAVTVSPDNKNVYVAGTGGSVAIFAKSRTGGYVQAAGINGCISSNDTPLCGAAGPGLAGAAGLAVSHDGKSLYVVGSSSSDVVAFARSTTTGALTRAGCVADHAFADCADGFSLGGPMGVAVSADGKSVYVAAGAAGAIDNFQRNTTTGALTERGCAAASFPCAEEATAVGGAAAVAVSPNGKSVYTGAVGNDADYGGISVFARTTAASGLGNLSQLDRPPVGCLAETYAGDDCRKAAHGLDGAVQSVVTKDGKNVYVITNSDTDTIAVLGRNTTTGVLTSEGCLGSEACAQPISFDPFNSLNAIVASPDSKFVYVAAESAIGMFSRNTSTGALTFVSCIADSNVPIPGCAPVDGLEAVSDMAISNDGKSLIATQTPSSPGFGPIGHPLDVFNRSTKTGALTPWQCDGDPEDHPTCLGVPGLSYGYTVAISPDGKSVYIGGDALFRFSRKASTGTLIYQGCSSPSPNPSQPLPCTEDDSLPDYINKLVVTSDSKALLIAGGADTSKGFSGQTTQEIRNTTTGTLTPTSQHVLGNTVVVSPDGKAVYTAAPYSGTSYLNDTTVEAFTRSTSAATYGVLTPVPGAHGCLDTVGGPAPGNACTGGTPAAGLENADNLAMSPNGKSLYITGNDVLTIDRTP